MKKFPNVGLGNDFLDIIPKAKINKWDYIKLGFPGGSDGKESACNEGDLSSIPRSGRFPWRRKWQPTPVPFTRKFHGWKEPGGLQSMGSQRVRHDWATSLSLSHQTGKLIHSKRNYPPKKKIFDREKILANHILSKKSISKILKGLIQCRELYDIFPKKTYR